jgi:hypothetical protein
LQCHLRRNYDIKVTDEDRRPVSIRATSFYGVFAVRGCPSPLTHLGRELDIVVIVASGGSSEWWWW